MSAVPPAPAKIPADACPRSIRATVAQSCSCPEPLLRSPDCTLMRVSRILFPLAVALIAFRAWPAMSIIVLGAPDHEPGRIPPDWQVREHTGHAVVGTCAANEGFCVRLASQNSSFALEHSVDVDPAALPFLAWRWKV